MYETVKEVDEETITKKNITLLTRDNTNLPQFDNVENIGENNNSIMIEAGVTKKLKKKGQLKDYYVYLLNNANYIFQDKPLETFMDDDDKMDETLRKFFFNYYVTGKIQKS